MSGGPYNPLVQFADKCGFESVEQCHPLIDDKTFVGTAAGGWVNDEDARKRDHYVEGCYRAIDTEARKGRDVSIADVIDTTSTWTSHLDNYLTLVQGGEIATLSILDFANGEADGDKFHFSAATEPSYTNSVRGYLSTWARRWRASTGAATE